MSDLDNKISSSLRLASEYHFSILEYTKRINISDVLLDFKLGFVRDPYLISLCRNFLINNKKLNDLTYLHYNNKKFSKDRFIFIKYDLPEGLI